MAALRHSKRPPFNSALRRSRKVFSGDASIAMTDCAPKAELEANTDQYPKLAPQSTRV